MELVRRRMDGVLSPTCTVPGRKIKRGWCRMNAGQAQDQRQAECSPGSEESLKNRSTKQEGRRQRYPGQTDRCFLCWRWLTAVAAGYCLAASTHSLRCPAFQWVNWHSDEPRHTDTHVQGRGHVSAPLPSPPLTCPTAAPPHLWSSIGRPCTASSAAARPLPSRAPCGTPGSSSPT